VRVPTDSIQVGERVIGFQLEIKNAMIVGLPSGPVGWGLVIDNVHSMEISYKGRIGIGAAAFDLDNKDDLQRLDKFVIIEEDGYEPIDLKLELIVTTDFEHERHILLKHTGLQLIPFS